jgi:DNA-binding IclR family transcriptional regulator
MCEGSRDSQPPATAELESTDAGGRAPAATRAAMILKLLANQRGGLGVSEIGRKLDLFPSTCLHVLRALVDQGFVAFDPQHKTYRTSIGLLSLVRHSLASGGFQQAVQPQLDRLSAQHRITALAVELDNFDRMVVVAISRANNIVSLHVDVGSRFPSLISATGRCVAAESGLSKTELKLRFKDLRWERAPRFEDWYAEIKRAGTEKVAIDRGFYARGITVLATLLPPTSENYTRGIALIGLEHQMTEELLGQLRDEILDAAREVSSKLG